MNKVILSIDNVYSRIIGPISAEVADEIYDALSFKEKGFEFKYQYINKNWDGVTRLFNKSRKSFLTGLAKYVYDILVNNGYKVTIKDNREVPAKNRNWILDLQGIELYDFQKETIERAVQSCRGVFSIPTGGGKTLVFTCIIQRLNVAPVIVYVPSILLLQQTKEEIERFLRDENGEPVEVGMIGAGQCDIKDINVMTIQTAALSLDYVINWKTGGIRKLKYGEEEKIYNATKKRMNYEFPDMNEDLSFVKSNKEKIVQLIKNAKVVIVDEAHRASSKIYQAVLKSSFSAYYRYAFSATARREDNTEMLIYGVFGRKILDYNCSDLIRRNILTKPYIIMVPAPPYIGEFSAGIDYDTIRKKYIIYNEERNKLIAEITKKVIELGICPVMLLVREVRHGKELHNLLKDTAEFICGSTSLKKKTEVMRQFIEGEIPCIIATPICDEGVNIKPLRCLILCDAGKSVNKLYQRIGRSLRTCPGKPNSVIIDFIDNEKILRRHTIRRRNVYMKEDEFTILDV